MTPKHPLHHLALGLILAGFGLSSAMAQPEEKLRVLENHGEYAIQLGWLNEGRRTPIELRGANASHGLKLPVPHRLKIEESKLEMIYTNSISLLPRSQLAVTLNERVLAQLPIKAEQPDNAARITLPSNALKPGYHDLGFRAAHHYTNECEDPSAPELYSQVDALQSVLRLKTSRKPVETSLAKLSHVFDSKLWLDHYDLELLVPAGSLERDAELRQAAAQISQSVASAFEYLPVSVRVRELTGSAAAEGNFPGLSLPEKAWDAVLLGTRDELAPVLNPSIQARIKEGYIGLFRSDQDPTRAILVVSGVTPAQVLQAATTLNLPGIALPDRQDVSISDLQMDSGYRRIQPAEVEKGWIRFDELGLMTTTMKGMYPPPTQLEFWAFREMFDPARPYIETELNFAYGAGFDKKSALNVMLNGQFVQALPMQDKHGEQLWRVKVKIPTIALRPGNNTLSFVPSMIGEDVGGACEPIFTENLYVSIFADSRIELPPLSDFMGFPDLELMAKTGLPYTRMADGKNVGVLVSDLRQATMGSALTLVAKLRQIHKSPLTALEFVTARSDLNNLDGLLVVGDITSLPDAVVQEMSSFLPGQRWQTLQVGTLRDTDLGEGARRWIEQPMQPFVKLTQINTPATARVAFSEGLGSSTAMVQYMSPKLGMPVTVLTATDPERLREGAAQMVEHSTWGAMTGSATLWSPDGEAIAQAFPVTHDFIGDKPAVNPASYLLSDRPWMSVAAALALILLIAGLTWWLLRMRAHRMNLDT
ncbi:MAG: cellulose biosynthesis cyclic di-GMP-binding regulatory protein BcsB [Pseudomonadota bacterium]